MSEGTDGFCKTRTVLGDLTNRVVGELGNRPTKRGFSMISADSEPKSGDGYDKNVDSEEGNSQFSLGVEDLVREKRRTKLGVDCNPKAVSLPNGKSVSGSSSTCSAGDSSSDDTASVTFSVPNDVGEKSDDNGGNTRSVTEAGDALRDNGVSIVSIPTCSALCKNDCCGGGGKCQYEKASNPLCEGLVTVVRRNDEKDLGVGKLESTKYGSIEWSRLPSSQGLKSHEFKKLERCTALKGDGIANLNAGCDLLKDCSCPFCLQAAYILSDLQYKDIKGRIAALKKSQKEASILVQKSFRGKEIDTKGQGHSNKASKLEYGLSSQWRSLFLHMEDMFVHEGNHLQENYVMLKGLRDSCKMELEMTVGVPSERQ